MTDERAASSDPIATFYERHPYPPPVPDLDRFVAAGTHSDERRFGHHLRWPDRRPEEIEHILIAGCGTSQSARWALRYPDAQVVGIDVSPTSIAHTRSLVDRHDIANLRTELLAIEEVRELGLRFDHVVCTGVLHHLADPDAGLRALASCLAPRGVVTLMVYAPHGRHGIGLLQRYCRLLGVEPTDTEIDDLVRTLAELPPGHPIEATLRSTRDGYDGDALADALLNPRERSYDVGDLFDLLDRTGLRFDRWERQAPYLPDCGSISASPHVERLLAMDERAAAAAMELLRGNFDRHTVIARSAGDPTTSRISLDTIGSARPIVDPAAIAVDDAARLPDGAAAALIDRRHHATDLVLFVDDDRLATFRAIDGERTVDELGADPLFVEQLWRHDLVVLDTAARTQGSTDHAVPAAVASRDPNRVELAGGQFVMGSDDHYPEESPTHRVRVSPFALDRHEVTNARFTEFVEDTGYVTVAERPLDPADYPGAPSENLVPGSLVFTPTQGPVDLRHLSQWWTWVPGASWRHPLGPRSNLAGLADHPVVHVAHEDATAFADWTGARLPTEAEWEFAARGGLERAAFSWGDEPRPDGRIMANTWDGTDFPWRSTGESGWERTAPVGSFPPNGFGLHDMAGNVWEWTDDWWTARHPDAADSPCCVPTDPRGGSAEASLDPAQPQFAVPRKVIKGGSHLCADSYCLRYRPAARRPQMIDTGMSHLGFRCAYDASTATTGQETP